MRLGILTGGGDAPGLNAVIRAVVRAATRQQGWPPVLGIPEGFKGLVEGHQPLELTPFRTRGLIQRGGTILHTTNRANPFAYPVGDNAYEDRSDQVVARLEELGIEGLIVLGGDGTLTIAEQLARKGVNVVGCPKTIDNDIRGTDQCFGHATAVDTATRALDQLHTTAESHHRVMVVEMMGRYAGWIALRSGIAGSADAILIPEIPFDVDLVCNKIQERARGGSEFSIVAVAEGAQPRGGSMAIMEEGESVYQPRLGGMGEQVTDMIGRKTGMEARLTVLGHVQRGGSPIPEDRLLATRFGVAAVDAAAAGDFPSMVRLNGMDVDRLPLADVVGGYRPVPTDHHLLHSARSVGIILGD